MRFTPIIGVLALAALSGCSDTATDAAASGGSSTATISQEGADGTTTVTRSTDGSQTVVRQSGPGARDATTDADGAIGAMREDAAAAVQR